VTRPDISVVVPTFRRPTRIRRFVAAMEAQTLDRARFEVVIVDNGSGDETSDVLAELAASTSLDLRPLHIEVNAGPAPARNLGWRSSRGRYVAFTDDDCVPHPDWLERLLARADTEPELGVLQGATHLPPGPHSMTLDTLFRETLAPSMYFEGCNLTFPRTVLERTGGFDESFHFGGEDTSAGWAAIATGGDWVFEPSAVVEHDVEERPLRWHLTMAWREGTLVDVAKRYPELRRRGFWRPWAHRPWNVAFAAGAVATVVAVKRPIALLAWLPWLSMRCPSVRHPRSAARVVTRNLLNDAVVEAGMVRASIRNRIFVL
jgi:glycosyltransferase involved in cell wall biosynthesis